MHDSVTLQVLRPDRQLASNLVLRGQRDGHTHRLEPTFRQLVHPSGEVLAHLGNRNQCSSGKKTRARKFRAPVVDVRSASASDSRSRIRKLEALEAYFLPSSRLANEAAGTTIRFIQASASPPLPHGR